MRLHQNVTLVGMPIEPTDAVTKEYVDFLTGGVIGGVFVTNVVPVTTGIVGNKQFVANTVPANAVITHATSDTPNVRISFIAEPNSAFYSPSITFSVDSGPLQPTTLNEKANDTRLFTGTADVVLPAGTSTIEFQSSTGATAQVLVTLAGAGPAFQTLTIGSPPGTQTTVKAGDVVNVQGAVENSAVYAEIIASGAAGALSAFFVGGLNSGGPGFRFVTGTITIGSGSGPLHVTARARNALGTFGANFLSQNTITLDQAFPVIAPAVITYPSGQSALKASETASITASITDFTSVTYTAVNLSVPNPTVYTATKVVTRIGGTYVFGVNNYTITAFKASNASQTIRNVAVTIADEAASAAITITGSPVRLISSSVGQIYSVVVSANQRLNTAPTLIASSGTFTGSWTPSGGGTTWTRTLVINDTDPKGAQTFSGLITTNLANVLGTVITSGATYIVGGFTLRTLTFPAFAQFVPIGTSVTNINNTFAQYTGASVLALQHSTANFFQGYTIVDSSGNYSATGDHLFITDQAFAGANTTGTLQVDIREIA